ncbi:MGMT family protein [Patescibacteria group bacterium]|nr:MGMT family protein [Patescibacteria group bacterium]
MISDFSKKDFRTKVVLVVKSIPKGKTMTYKAVAAKAGHPLAARAVGAIMRSNKDKSIPCHRVVGVRGLGGYNGLRGEKERLLKKEGAL